MDLLECDAPECNELLKVRGLYEAPRLCTVEHEGYNHVRDNLEHAV